MYLWPLSWIFELSTASTAAMTISAARKDVSGPIGTPIVWPSDASRRTLSILSAGVFPIFAFAFTLPSRAQGIECVYKDE